MGRRWWWAVAVAVVLEAAVVGTVGWLSSRPPAPPDPRAFAIDDGQVPFDEVLTRTGLAMPACLGDQFRYAFVLEEPHGFSYRDLYLEFATDDTCLTTFLGVNPPSRRWTESYVGPPFPNARPPVVAAIGWPWSIEPPVELFQIRNRFEITGVIDRAAEAPTVHVRIFGWVPP